MEGEICFIFASYSNKCHKPWIQHIRDQGCGEKVVRRQIAFHPATFLSFSFFRALYISLSPKGQKNVIFSIICTIAFLALYVCVFLHYDSFSARISMCWATSDRLILCSTSNRNAAAPARWMYHQALRLNLVKSESLRVASHPSPHDLFMACRMCGPKLSHLLLCLTEHDSRFLVPRWDKNANKDLLSKKRLSS